MAHALLIAILAAVGLNVTARSGERLLSSQTVQVIYNQKKNAFSVLRRGNRTFQRWGDESRARVNTNGNSPRSELAMVVGGDGRG